MIKIQKNVQLPRYPEFIGTLSWHFSKKSWNSATAAILVLQDYYFLSLFPSLSLETL